MNHAISTAQVSGVAQPAAAEGSLVAAIDRVSVGFGYLTAAMLFGMLLVICYDVTMRYVFNQPTIWATEISTYLLVAIVFLGLAYTHKENGHIRVELLLGHFSAPTRAFLDAVTSWIGVILLAVACWQAVLMIHDNYVNGTRSFSLLTTPLYLPQIPVAVGLTGFLLAVLAEIRRPLESVGGLRDGAVVGIIAATAAGLFALGARPPAFFDTSYDWGTIAVAAAAIAVMMLWSGWRVTLTVAGFLAAAGAMLFGARGLGIGLVVAVLGVLAFLLLGLGMRISLALGSLGLLGILFLLPAHPLITVAQRGWEGLESFTLTALPMFVLMGAVLLRSGLTELMFDALTKWIGGVRGGLAYAGIGACSIFAAVSGSSVATAATVGMVACPEMMKRGYSPLLSYGAIAAGGTLGILIPPSIVMIIYGATVGAPIATLFVAGVIPGLLLTLGFMAVILAWTRARPEAAPPSAAAVSWAERWRSLVQLLPIMALIAGVIAVLYLGIATPTEAAAVATLVAMIMCWQRGRMPLDALKGVLLETVRISAFLLFIVIGASILSFVFDYLRLPALLVEAVKAAELSPGVVLLAIAIPYVVLGMFVDPISMMVMTLPVLFPLVVAMGFDSIWFGVILVLLVEIGLIFPPIGMNLSVLKSIGGTEVTLRQIVLGSLPFMAVMGVFIVVLYWVPGLVTWLPRTMS